MPLSAKDITSQLQGSGQQSTQKPSGSSSRKTQIPDWNIEEKLETTLDKDGNPVPDHAFTDGDKMMRGDQGPDEADPYEAATEDFD